MVKPKPEPPWLNPPTSSTGSTQLRKYLDVCSDWIVEPSDEIADHAIPVLPASPVFGKTTCPNIGVLESDLQHSKSFECYTCSRVVCLGEHGKVVVANPFTRAQYMLQCNTCL